MADNKPAAVPSWATDATFTSGPKTGSPTKVEPSNGAKAQGEVPGQNYRGERVNWLWNLLCSWAFFLSDLHNQVQFLNKNYVWTGNHEFQSQLLLNTNPVFPNAGVARQSWLSMGNAISGYGGAGNVSFDQDLNAFAGVGSSSNVVQIVLPFRIPAGATLTKATVVAFHGGGYDLKWQIYRRSCSLSGSSRAVVAAAITLTASGSFSSGSPTLASVASEDHEYFIEFSFSDPASSHVKGVQIEWTDRNVRNWVR